MGAFKGGDEEDYDEEGEYERGEDIRAYAASPVLGRSRSANAGAYSAESNEDVGPSPRPSYSSGYSAPTAPQAQALTSYAEAPKQSAEEEEEEEPKGPGLLERFKETKAYDRLTEELSTVGERVVEELSRTATTVVVPMLLNKLKSLIGIDLSQQRGGGARQSTAGGSQSSASQSPSSQQNFAPSGAGAQGKENASTGASGSASGASGTASGTSGTSGSTARAAGAGGTEGYGAS